MKYLLLAMILVGCSAPESLDTRLNREANNFCRCHKGVDLFVYTGSSYSLLCKDGNKVTGTGLMEYTHFRGCDE